MKNLVTQIECYNRFVETRYNFHASGGWIFKENKSTNPFYFISYICFPGDMMNRKFELFTIDRWYGKSKNFFHLSIVSARHRKHFKKAIKRWANLQHLREKGSLCESCIWMNNYLMKGKCYEDFKHI